MKESEEKLRDACKYGNKDEAKKLLEEGVDPNCTNDVSSFKSSYLQLLTVFVKIKLISDWTFVIILCSL